MIFLTIRLRAPRLLACAFVLASGELSYGESSILPATILQGYVETFNQHDHTIFGQAISNEDAARWMEENVPRFECPDKDIEEIYHFRWWTYRKHIKETSDGFVITEFLPQVTWSGKENTINCAAGHHLREGRWIRNPKYLDDYSAFWFRKGANPRAYSFWAADSIYQRALVRGDFSLAVDLLPDLVKIYQEWERSRLCADGLFWQIDDRDGMEVSIGGSGKRATINSYMYGDARAIAAIAKIAGKPEIETEYTAKAERLRKLVNEKLWDKEARFYKTLPRSQYEMVEPRNSHDTSVTRLNWFDKAHLGTREWFQYTFPTAQAFQASAVYWHINESAPLPADWSISYLDGDVWKPVATKLAYPVRENQYGRVDFSPVTSTALRLEVQSQPNKVAGIYEWQVFSGDTNLSNLAKISHSIASGQNIARGQTVTTLNDGNGASKDAGLVDVRELHGYTPWYFDLPETGKGHEVAWKQLMDPKGFKAPFGPTTAEQRNSKFSVSYTGHECQWNGPSWPFATAVTLTALANVLNDYPQDAITREDYFATLKTYTKSQHLKADDGTGVPWIDEDLNPFTGDWIARSCQKNDPKGPWNRSPRERGKDYNHSTYCDLIINGLVGLRPRADNSVEVNPLVPRNTWDYFCLDRVPYHGHLLTVLYDLTGKKYGKGSGLRVLADGREIGSSANLEHMIAKLPD